jgi:hypothetical protein
MARKNETLKQMTFSADPQAIRKFVIRVNTDKKFRKAFLEKPVQTATSSGITLNKDAEHELELLVECLSRYMAQSVTLENDFFKCLGYAGIPTDDLPWTIVP